MLPPLVIQAVKKVLRTVAYKSSALSYGHYVFARVLDRTQHEVTRLGDPNYPVLARIFAIADVFDALTSHRPYKQPLSYEETIDILRKGSGSHFDPRILDAFEKISRSLYDRYGSGDDDAARKDLKAIVGRYNTADIVTFFE